MNNKFEIIAEDFGLIDDETKCNYLNISCTNAIAGEGNIILTQDISLSADVRIDLDGNIRWI